MLRGSCLSEAIDSLQRRIDTAPHDSDDEAMDHDSTQVLLMNFAATVDPEDEDEADEGPMQGEKVLNHTVLARSKGTLFESSVLL